MAEEPAAPNFVAFENALQRGTVALTAFEGALTRLGAATAQLVASQTTRLPAEARVVESARKLGDQQERSRRREQQKEKEQASLTQNIRQGATGAIVFAQALLKAPGTLLGIVTKSLDTAAPGVLSTLTKSFQLLLFPLAKVFTPAILDLSEWMQRLAHEMEVTGDAASVLADALLEAAEAALIKAGKEASFAADIERIATKRASIELKRLEEEGRRANAPTIAALPGVLSQLGLFEDAWAAYLRQLEQERAKQGKDAGGFWKELMGGTRALFETFIPGYFKDAGKGKEFGGLKTDILPPGYQSRVLEIGDLRRQLETAALGTTSLDMKMYQQQQDFFNWLQRHLQERQARDNAPQLPPR